MATELFTTPNCQVLSLTGQFAPPDGNVNAQARISFSEVEETIANLDDSLPLIVVLDSIGGSVHEATSITTLLKEKQANSSNITLLISNRAFSAATILTSCLPRVVAVSNAQLMIHGVSLNLNTNQDCYLDSGSARELFEVLDSYNDSLAYFYARKSGLAMETFKSIIDRQYLGSPGELYLNVDGAKNLRLIDDVVKDVKSYFNKHNLNYPEEFYTRYG